MTLARSVIDVVKGSGRASSSLLLAIAEKQLQERRWQRKKQENAVPLSRKNEQLVVERQTRGRKSIFELGYFAVYRLWV